MGHLGLPLRPGARHFGQLEGNYLLPLLDKGQTGKEALHLDPLAPFMASQNGLLACLRPRDREALAEAAAAQQAAVVERTVELPSLLCSLPHHCQLSLGSSSANTRPHTRPGTTSNIDQNIPLSRGPSPCGRLHTPGSSALSRLSGWQLAREIRPECGQAGPFACGESGDWRGLIGGQTQK